MIWSLIGSIGGKAPDIVDDVVEDKNKANRLKFEIRGHQNPFQERQLEARSRRSKSWSIQFTRLEKVLNIYSSSFLYGMTDYATAWHGIELRMVKSPLLSETTICNIGGVGESGISNVPE